MSDTWRTRAVRLLLILIAVVWSGFPIFLVVMSSFKDVREIFEVPPLSLVFSCQPTYAGSIPTSAAISGVMVVVTLFQKLWRFFCEP